MICPNDQYHALVKASKSMVRKDMTEKAIIVCAYVSNFESVSERNLLSIMNYAGIDFQRAAPYRVLHFCFSTDMIKIRDEGLGLVKTLSSSPAKETYTEENINFARNEMERIRRSLLDG